MRKKIVAGNWKMNNDLSETRSLLEEILEEQMPNDVKVMVAPSFTNLHLAHILLLKSSIEVIAQNMHESEGGAFTGEVSADMLKALGVETVILGHSERRAYFHETNRLLSKKVTTAIKNKMTAIFCIGEELTDRKTGNHFEVVKKQLEEGLFHISVSDWQHIILAYEPVWAIGTGETASPDQAQEMHAFIRNTISEFYSESVANQVSILYGGSVNQENAREIFSQSDVDGGLIGGAALKARSFISIVKSF
jgi:triosephosphate isomerase